MSAISPPKSRVAHSRAATRNGASCFRKRANLIDSGAKLDVHGFEGSLNKLSGAGSIVDNGAAVSLYLANGGAFSGTISNALSIEVGPATMVFTGTNTYT